MLEQQKLSFIEKAGYSAADAGELRLHDDDPGSTRLHLFLTQ